MARREYLRAGRAIPPLLGLGDGWYGPAGPLGLRVWTGPGLVSHYFHLLIRDAVEDAKHAR